jgi:hypothetical protein
MKIITWFKSLGLVAVLGGIGAAVLMVMRAHAAGRLEAEIKHQEARVDALGTASADEVAAAAKLQEQIAVKKVKAREIRKKAEKHQERIGEDETMADIAARFNGKRVRGRSDTTA